MSLKADGAASGLGNVDVMVSFKSILADQGCTRRRPGQRCVKNESST